MAEGPYPGHSKEVTMKIDCRELECPICLDQLQHPKSLPCLHTFCQDCLCDYIVKEVSMATTFSCPICRKEITPVDPSADRQLWAKQFPLNSLLAGIAQGHTRQNMGQGHHKSSSTCDPCKKKGFEFTAVFWCDLLMRGFCEECKSNHHDVIHEGCGPEFTGEDMATETSFELCTRHGIEMDFFCEDHQSLYCGKCVALNHRQCSSVPPAYDYCQTLRAGPTLGDMRSTFGKALKAMDFVVTASDNQMQEMMFNKNTTLSQVQHFRSDIDTHLNNLQARIEQEVVNVHDEDNKKLKQQKKICTAMRTQLSNVKTLFETTQVMNDDRQMISVYQQGKSAIESCRQLVDKTSKEYKTRTIRHELDFDPSKLRDHISLGKITTMTVQRTLPINRDLEIPRSLLKVTRVSSITIKLPSDTVDCYVTGVLYLSDGRLVVVDNANRKLKLFGKDGTCLDHLVVNKRPWGVCHHSDNRVAITMTTSNSIMVVTVGLNMLQSLYEVDAQTRHGGVYGLAYVAGTYVITSEYTNIQIPEKLTPAKNSMRKPVSVECPYFLHAVNPDGSIDSQRLLSNASLYLVADPQHRDLILSTNNKGSHSVAVSRFSQNRPLQTVVMADILKGPRGIDIDKEGNIYACGHSSHNIIQMARDGTRLRELLTAVDGIRHPMDISVCDDNFAVSFDSWDRRNDIYLYHLDI